MKNFRKKLILSIMTVVLALLSLGTSTYAWFTMSQTATVSGMSMSVISPSSLEISTDQVDWKFNLSLEDMEHDKLNASYYDGGLDKFYYPNSVTNPVQQDGTPTIAFDKTSEDFATNWKEGVQNTHYMTDVVYVRANGANVTYTVDIKTITLTMEKFVEGRELYKSILVGFKYNGKMYIYKTTERTNLTSTFEPLTEDDKLQFEVSAKVNEETNIMEYEIAEIGVYLWFNGESPYCTNMNVIDGKYVVGFVFEGDVQ